MTQSETLPAAIAPSNVIEQLLVVGETLPTDLADAIRSLGKSAVPRLLEILQDESMQEISAEGEGYAPTHAADLLIDMKAEEAILPMLKLYDELEFDIILRDRIAVRFPEYGKAALEPILTRLTPEAVYDDVESYAWMLVELGVHDERIAEVLKVVLREEPETAATMIGIYGDPGLVPMLMDEVQARKIDGRLGTARFAIEAENAFKKMGVEIPEAIENHLEACKAYFGAPKPIVPVKRVTPKIGRNDPCPCGSGKKYKRCCLN